MVITTIKFEKELISKRKSIFAVEVIIGTEVFRASILVTVLHVIILGIIGDYIQENLFGWNTILLICINMILYFRLELIKLNKEEFVYGTIIASGLVALILLKLLFRT